MPVIFHETPSHALQNKTEEELAAFFWKNPDLQQLSLHNYQGDSLPRLPEMLLDLTISSAKNLLVISQINDALSSMRVLKCPQLTYLPAEMPNLRSLHLAELPELRFRKHPAREDLRYLELLGITTCPKLTELSVLCGNLVHLYLSDCVELKSIPDLPSTLVELIVAACPIDNLADLPSGLKRLRVNACPQLKSITVPATIEHIDLESCPRINMKIAHVSRDVMSGIVMG